MTPGPGGAGLHLLPQHSGARLRGGGLELPVRQLEVLAPAPRRVAASAEHLAHVLPRHGCDGFDPDFALCWHAVTLRPRSRTAALYVRRFARGTPPAKRRSPRVTLARTMRPPARSFRTQATDGVRKRSRDAVRYSSCLLLVLFVGIVEGAAGCGAAW